MILPEVEAGAEAGIGEDHGGAQRPREPAARHPLRDPTGEKTGDDAEDLERGVRRLGVGNQAERGVEQPVHGRVKRTADRRAVEFGD